MDRPANSWFLIKQLKMVYLTLTLILIVASSLVGHAQTLADYYQMAADSNPGLQAKYKAFEAAMTKVTQVKSLPDPVFSFGYFILPVETRVGPQQAKFSLVQQFPWFGTLKAQGDVYALQAEAKYQEFVDARNKLYYEVSAAYYPLYELNEWKRIIAENIQILETYKRVALAKYKNNQGDMVDVIRVEIMINDAKTQLKILDEKEKPLNAILNKLLNRPAETPVPVSTDVNIDPLPLNYRKDSLLTSNPRLRELDLRMEATRAAEISAKKQGAPKFGVGLDYVLVGNRTDVTGLDNNGRDVLMPMVSLSIPIFRGKYDGAIEEAKLLRESYALQRKEVENSLTASYEAALFEIDRQRRLIELYDAQVKESEKALKLLFTAYSNSGNDFIEVLRMEQQLLQYEQLKASAIAKYHIAVAQLNYITANE